MKLYTLLTAAAVTGLFSMAMPVTAIAVTTADFVKEASIGNEFEVEASKLALDKSQNKDIKTFANAMIGDHTQAEDSLRQLLESSTAGLKVEENLDDKHQALMNKLQSLSTDGFNNEYIATQITAHKQAVELFKDYASNGDDPRLRKFAITTLPTVQAHLQMVEKLKEK